MSIVDFDRMWARAARNTQIDNCLKQRPQFLPSRGEPLSVTKANAQDLGIRLEVTLPPAPEVLVGPSGRTDPPMVWLTIMYFLDPRQIRLVSLRGLPDLLARSKTGHRTARGNSTTILPFRVSIPDWGSSYYHS